MIKSIDCFWFKNLETGLKDSKCSDCRMLKRPKEIVHARYKRRYDERGGREKAKAKRQTQEYKDHHNEYLRMKAETDPKFKITKSLRQRLTCFIKGETGKMKYVQMAVEIFMKWLELHFKKGMSWSNYGKKGWHIDHVIPCASFEFTKEEYDEDIKKYKCFGWFNCMPLWAEENISKGDKIIPEAIAEQRKRVLEFLKTYEGKIDPEWMNYGLEYLN
jgi:hypothetical protein